MLMLILVGTVHYTLPYIYLHVSFTVMYAHIMKVKVTTLIQDLCGRIAHCTYFGIVLLKVLSRFTQSGDEQNQGGLAS